MKEQAKSVKLPTVLVVDDAADAAESTAKVLQLAGFDARVARSGEEALHAIEAVTPDAVLLDIGMPDMDGWELARRVAERCGPMDRRPLLVAVTGYAADSDRERSDQAGIALHLVKPVDPVALVGLLRRFGRVLDTTAAG